MTTCTNPNGETSMTNPHDGPRSWRILLLAALIVVALFSLMVAFGAASELDRLERQVGVMEKVMDEVLVQSPNVIVSSRSATRGLALDDYGVVLTFDAKLTGGDSVFTDGRVFFGPQGHVRFDRGGRDGDDEQVSLEELRARAETARRERLDAFRQELVEVLVDYGPTLTALPGDRWVTVIVFLEDDPFGRGSEAPSRLVAKAKMRDLRGAMGGQLSAQEAATLIQFDER